MIYEEFRRHIFKAGLTIAGFAKLMNMSRISLSNLSGGPVPNSLAVIAVLMGELKESGVNFVDIITRLDLSPKKPRGAGKIGKFGGHKHEVPPGVHPQRRGQRQAH